jgi:hypothetical protein
MRIYKVSFDAVIIDGFRDEDSREVGESYPRPSGVYTEREVVRIEEEYICGKLVVSVHFDNEEIEEIHEGISKILKERYEEEV